MNNPSGGIRTYRVVQWATGNIGLRALRAVIEHPTLELAGLYVTSAEKEGRDAGELAGLKAVGVKATRKIEDIIALKPDCVLYMPLHLNLDELCALLESGANVVTTVGDFLNPKLLDPAMRSRVEAACAKGKSSIHSTGSSPGFITEAMPLVLTSISRRLDCLTIDEYADTSSRNSPDMIFQIMGFGAKPAASFDQTRLAYVAGHFQQSLYLIADALGLPLDGVETKGEMACARSDTTIAAGLIPKDTVAATRITLSGIRGGKPLLRFRANWYVSRDLDQDWDLGETGWRVLVEGDTPLDMRIKFPVPLEQWAAFTPGLTAHRPVNAVRFVCEAAPGIQTTVDLPQIIARLG
jgi:4-hydroxy-tetrahydrodipicolinate reductase